MGLGHASTLTLGGERRSSDRRRRGTSCTSCRSRTSTGRCGRSARSRRRGAARRAAAPARRHRSSAAPRRRRPRRPPSPAGSGRRGAARVAHAPPPVAELEPALGARHRRRRGLPPARLPSTDLDLEDQLGEVVPDAVHQVLEQLEGLVLVRDQRVDLSRPRAGGCPRAGSPCRRGAPASAGRSSPAAGSARARASARRRAPPRARRTGQQLLLDRGSERSRSTRAGSTLSTSSLGWKISWTRLSSSSMSQSSTKSPPAYSSTRRWIRLTISSLAASACRGPRAPRRGRCRPPRAAG